MPFVPDDLEFELFNPSLHDVDQFTCGKSELIDNYIRYWAQTMQEDDLHRTYVAVRKVSNIPAMAKEPIEGFFTLSVGEITTVPEMPVNFEANMHMQARGRVPVVWLEWVAVHKQWIGSGMGTALIVEALRVVEAVSRQVGVAGCALKPVTRHKVIARYEEIGFHAIDFDKEKEHLASLMFIPMHQIRELLIDIPPKDVAEDEEFILNSDNADEEL